MARFDSFVILGAMRTGSNLLEDLLGQFDGVTCHGELFNPVFVGRAGQGAHLGIDLAARDADPFALLSAIRRAPGLPGFRLFHDHDPRVLAHVLADARCAKIVLSRNPLESYVSLQIARATDQWRLTDPTRHRSARAHFDAADFAAYLDTLQGFHHHIRRALQTTGQTAFHIGYDDLGDVEVLNGLAAHLGLTARLETAGTRLKRQNPGPLRDKVENPEAMAAALADADRFGLSDMPETEPRRGAGLPAYRAAPRAPLLYLALRGGPDTAVCTWLAALDGAGPEAVTSGFTRATLGDWMQARPGHRVFTVLRHPVARAWAAFDEGIRPGRFTRICAVLRRSHGLTLPEPGTEAAADPAVLRADFLGFLGFVKANLAGRTAVRTDPLWSTQRALLRGHAQARMPDLILREGEADAFARLAALAGTPALPAPAPETWPELATLYDDTVEAAARAAFAPDYTDFGFGPWR